jgi:hypothetical protein
MQQTDLPPFFCWTRFGTEAGEPIRSILHRKEIERLANNGTFYWGIGNSVAPGIASLLERAGTPQVLFSPIKSRPRRADVAPECVVRWREATTIAGDRIALADTVRVTSRPSRSHYALVCSASEPLDLGHLGSLRFGELRNLVSGNRLGASQVTAVVSRELNGLADGDDGYVVALRARLVEPYFVRLAAPCVEAPVETERRAA